MNSNTVFILQDYTNLAAFNHQTASATLQYMLVKLISQIECL